MSTCGSTGGKYQEGTSDKQVLPRTGDEVWTEARA